MDLSPQEIFHLEEYKALRDEITKKLSDRLQLNRWGLFGLAVVYSYIFSNVGHPLLLWVPVGLSLVIVALLISEHRSIARAGACIRDHLEPRFAATHRDGTRSGWETFLVSSETPAPMVSYWRWFPTPIWMAILVCTLLIAAIGDIAPRQSLVPIVIVNANDHKLHSIEFTDSHVVLVLLDGRKLEAPLDWYPVLKRASAIERSPKQLKSLSAYWPEFNEEVSVLGVLNGRRGRGFEGVSSTSMSSK
jgi:hypothetical protein